MSEILNNFKIFKLNEFNKFLLAVTIAWYIVIILMKLSEINYGN